VWAVSRGIAAPAGLPKDVETALTGYLEKTINSKEHKSKAVLLDKAARSQKNAIICSDVIEVRKANCLTAEQGDEVPPSNHRIFLPRRVAVDHTSRATVRSRFAAGGACQGRGQPVLGAGSNASGSR
jgi:hypothetical protein